MATGRRAEWWWCGKVLIQLLILGVVPVGPALGRTWVASPDGKAGDGPISEIIDRYAEGDSIECLPGVHAWPHVSLARSVSIVGGGAGEVAIVPELFAFSDCAYLTVEGVTIRGNSGGFGTQRVQRVSFRSVTLSDNRAGMWFFGAQEASFIGCTISDNVVTDEALGASGIVLAEVNRAEFFDCLFQSNESNAGRPLDESPGGAALVIGARTAATVRGCIFVGNRCNAGGAMYQTGAAHDLMFEQNTIVANVDLTGAVVLNGSGESQVVRGNIFANNIGFGLWCGDHTLYSFNVYCNVFWQNQGYGGLGSREQNNWYGPISARGRESTTDFYSVVADPVFCQDESYGLSKKSPLWFPMEPCTAVPGAGRDCVAKPILKRSWGSLKQAFQK